jgi:hypothetical protein
MRWTTKRPMMAGFYWIRTRFDGTSVAQYIPFRGDGEQRDRPIEIVGTDQHFQFEELEEWGMGTVLWSDAPIPEPEQDEERDGEEVKP